MGAPCPNCERCHGTGNVPLVGPAGTHYDVCMCGHDCSEDCIDHDEVYSDHWSDRFVLSEKNSVTFDTDLDGNTTVVKVEHDPSAAPWTMGVQQMSCETVKYPFLPLPEWAPELQKLVRRKLDFDAYMGPFVFPWKDWTPEQYEQWFEDERNGFSEWDKSMIRVWLPDEIFGLRKLPGFYCRIIGYQRGKPFTLMIQDAMLLGDNTITYIPSMHTHPPKIDYANIQVWKDVPLSNECPSVTIQRVPLSDAVLVRVKDKSSLMNVHHPVEGFILLS